MAFQILNDLKDWQGDSDNKLLSGQDALAARPTLLLALALDGSTPDNRAELLAILAGKGPSDRDVKVARVRVLFTRANVFAKAEKLIEKYRAKAEAIADETEPVELRELLYYLVNTVLDRPGVSADPEPALHQLLPAIGRS